MNEKELLQNIGKLPRDLPPARDLWPDIESRLESRSAADTHSAPSRWPIALAASVVLAFTVGLMSGRLLIPGPGIVDEAAPGLAATTPQLMFQAALMESEREYQAAFREFIPVGYARANMDEALLASVEEAWMDLQQQESSLLAALEANPGHPYLGQTLLSLRARQLEFLKQMAMLDQTSWRTT